MQLNQACILTLLASGALTLTALKTHAETQGDSGLSINQALYQPIATLTIGPDFVQNGQAQTISLIPPFQNYFTNTNASTTVADAGVLIGVERMLSNRLSVQLGVSGYVNEQMTPKGHVWLFASPDFDTLSYQYTIHHSRVMAEGKFLTTFDRYQSIHPYVSWGLGAAFNRTSNYHETPLILGAVPSIPFANHSQTAFTWGVGVGSDYTLNPHVRLGIGYQFADLGSGSLGPTPAAITKETLKFSHLYTNQIRFQLTYLV